MMNKITFQYQIISVMVSEQSTQKKNILASDFQFHDKT